MSAILLALCVFPAGRTPAPLAAIAREGRDGCACFTPDTAAARVERILRRFGGHGPNGYAITGRWSRTVAGTTGSAGDPVTLTYSFIPDGSIQTRDGVVENTLHATLDARFGSRGAWRAVFKRMFDDWSAKAGLRFIEEPNDDRALWPDTAGAAGVRGDIRILCSVQDGPSGLLAYAYFPNSGEIVLDSEENWADAAGNYRLMRNTLTHELGHAIGLGHVYPLDESKLMEPYINTGFDGPQDDDVRGAERNYGDAYESDDDSGVARDLGTFVPGYWRADASLHSAGDEDWITFLASAGQDVSVQVTPLGSAYPIGESASSTSNVDTRTTLPLRAELLAGDATTVLRTATAAVPGEAIATAIYRPSSGPVRLYVRVSSPATTGSVQRYALSLTSDPSATWSVDVGATLGVRIVCSPLDADGKSQRTAPATFRFESGAAVRLTAPEQSNATPFDRWVVNGAAQPVGQNTVELAVGANVTAFASYGAGLVVQTSEDAVIRAGEIVTLSANATGGTAPYSYAWSPGDGLSATSGATVSAQPSLSTSYTVTVEDAGGRIGFGEVRVAIADALQVSAGPDRRVLAGEVVSLTAERVGGVPPYSFTWGPAHIVGDEHWHSTSLRASVSETVWVEVLDGAGDVARDELAITIVEPLVVDIGDRIQGAAGETLALAPTITGGSPPYAYEWSDSLGSDLGTAESIAFSIRGESRVVLIVRDDEGQVASDSVAIGIGPPFVLTASASQGSVTPGTEITLSASVSGGTGPFTFAWSPEAQVSDPRAAVTGATVDGPTEFVVTAHDALGRGVSASVFVGTEGLVAGESILSPAGAPGLCGFGALLVVPLAAGLCVLGRRG